MPGKFINTPLAPLEAELEAESALEAALELPACDVEPAEFSTEDEFLLDLSYCNRY